MVQGIVNESKLKEIIDKKLLHNIELKYTLEMYFYL